MGSSLLLWSTLLLAPLPATSFPASADQPCLCTQSEISEKCGPERTTCHCVHSPTWTLVRFWAQETSRCEELVFFSIDGESPASRPE